MLKLTNAINSKINKQQALDYVFLGIFNCLTLILCIFFTSEIAFFMLGIVIIIDISYCYKIGKGFYAKTPNPIKYIILDEQTFEVVQVDKFSAKYNKNSIVKVNLDIDMALFKCSKGPAYKAPKKIIASFEMKNSKVYVIEIREIRVRNSINTVCRLMDMLSKQTEFRYKFSGLGYDQDFDEHIKTYKTKHVKLLMAEKDRKDLKSMSVVFLLGGLGICILYAFALGASSWTDFMILIKLYSIFVVISGLLYIPILIDEINLRKRM